MNEYRRPKGRRRGQSGSNQVFLTKMKGQRIASSLLRMVSCCHVRIGRRRPLATIGKLSSEHSATLWQITLSLDPVTTDVYSLNHRYVVPTLRL